MTVDVIMKIDPKQIAKMITEDPNEINPLDNTRDEFGRSCPGCGALGDGDDGDGGGPTCWHGAHNEPIQMACNNYICWDCLYSCSWGNYAACNTAAGMSVSGWFIDAELDDEPVEYYCPDHAAEAQARVRNKLST